MAEGAGKLIRYEYDLNRLRRVNYPDSTDVMYVYGAPGEAGDEHGNRAGRLVEEQSEAGKRTFWYDRLGNVAKLATEFPRLREPHRGPYQATMEYDFDWFGRLLSMKFPGSGAEVVTYGYDRGGLVRSAVGTNTQINPQHPDEPPVTQYLLHIGYDEFEQRVRVVHGNGIATSYGITRSRGGFRRSTRTTATGTSWSAGGRRGRSSGCGMTTTWRATWSA